MSGLERMARWAAACGAVALLGACAGWPEPPGPLRSALAPAIGGVLAPNPQALVKLIGTGGAANVRGLKAQMSFGTGHQ